MCFRLFKDRGKFVPSSHWKINTAASRNAFNLVQSDFTCQELTINLANTVRNNLQLRNEAGFANS